MSFFVVFFVFVIDLILNKVYIFSKLIYFYNGFVYNLFSNSIVFCIFFFEYKLFLFKFNFLGYNKKREWIIFFDLKDKI